MTEKSQKTISEAYHQTVFCVVWEELLDLVFSHQTFYKKEFYVEPILIILVFSFSYLKVTTKDPS